MSNWHELTDKIFSKDAPYQGSTQAIIDVVVREWLREKCIKLSGIFPKPNLSHKERADLFGEFLGLTEKEEVAVEKKWCEHIKMDSNGGLQMFYGNRPQDWAFCDDEFKFCPICGTPRPSEPSKRGKLAKIIQQAYLKSDYNSTETSLWLDIADAVIEELNKEDNK